MRHAAILLALLASCSDGNKPEPRREPERPRRLIEPPTRGVRALPPHAIRADGIGPYKLGASAADLLDQLPSGPRIRQFTIPGIAQRDMLRGENDAILIGTEPQGKATFVAVVRGEIARTESGIQVGSTRDEVAAALGPPVETHDRARDPRIVVPSKLDNAQFVFEGDRVVAIVLTPAPPPGTERPKEAASADKPNGCTRPTTTEPGRLFGACFTHAGEIVRVERDEIAVLARDSDRAVTAVRVPGLVFAAPLRPAGDGRDDIVAIARSSEGDALSWSLFTFRLIDGKLARVGEPTPVYQVTAANARWVGADLEELDLYLELTARADAIEVGGLLTTRVGNAIRDIVVITPKSVPRRRAKPHVAEHAAAGSAEEAGSATEPRRPSDPR